MPNYFHIDDGLIEQARRLGQHRTKKATIDAALREYIRRRRQVEILAIFGTIDYEETYSYKSERGSKHPSP